MIIKIQNSKYSIIKSGLKVHTFLSNEQNIVKIVLTNLKQYGVWTNIS